MGTQPPPAPQSLSRTQAWPAVCGVDTVMQLPATHTCVPVHARPQEPQLRRSLVTSVQVPEHTMPGGAQGVTQEPPVQS